jgi:hypothetical protein
MKAPRTKAGLIGFLFELYNELEREVTFAMSELQALTVPELQERVKRAREYLSDDAVERAKERADESYVWMCRVSGWSDET